MCIKVHRYLKNTDFCFQAKDSMIIFLFNTSTQTILKKKNNNLIHYLTTNFVIQSSHQKSEFQYDII